MHLSSSEKGSGRSVAACLFLLLADQRDDLSDVIQILKIHDEIYDPADLLLRHLLSGVADAVPELLFQFFLRQRIERGSQGIDDKLFVFAAIFIYDLHAAWISSSDRSSKVVSTAYLARVTAASSFLFVIVLRSFLYSMIPAGRHSLL